MKVQKYMHSVEKNSTSADLVKMTVRVYGEENATVAGHFVGYGASDINSATPITIHDFVSTHEWMHPSAHFDLKYDIGIIKLDRPSTATPGILYDGGDLGISDCKRMALTYLSWAGSDANVTKVKLHNHTDCAFKYHQETGSVYDEAHGHGTDGGVGTAEICVVTDPTDAQPQGPCYGDLGLPLVAHVKNFKGGMLLGLAHSDDCGSGLPADRKSVV